MARNSAIFGAGQVLLKIMSAVLAPLFTRLLTPHEYGVWGLGLMVFSLLGPLYSLSLHGAVTRFYFDTEDPALRARFQGTVSSFLLIWGVVLSALLLIGGPFILPHVLPSLPYWPYIPLIVGAAALGLAATVPTATWTAAERAGRVVLVRTASNAVYLLSAVALVAGFGTGVVGIFQARFASAVVLAVPLIFWAARRLRFAMHGPDLRAALVFSLPLVPHLLAHWVLSAADRALLEKLASTDAVGIYTSAYVFTDAVNMVAVSLNGAFVPMLNRHLDSDAKGARTVGRAVTWFVGVVLATAATVSVLSPGVVRAFFDPRYHEAAQVGAVLGAAGAMQGLYYIWVGALFARKQSGRVPLLTVIGGLVNVGLNLIWIPKFGLLGAALATAGGYGALLAGVMIAAKLGGGLPLELKRLRGWAALFIVVVAVGLLRGERFDPFVDLGLGLLILAAGAGVVLRSDLLDPADRAALLGPIARFATRLKR